MTSLNNPIYSRAKSIHEFTVLNLKGEPVKLEVYKGFICIIVNIATKSSSTKFHYKQFNELMDKFGEGLRILAFPCNQFGQEEPDTSEEIAAHAEENNVKFDIFAKIDVNGETASDVWKFLKNQLGGHNKVGDMIKGNYTKFLVDRRGIVVSRHGPEIQPAEFQELLKPYW